MHHVERVAPAVGRSYRIVAAAFGVKGTGSRKPCVVIEANLKPIRRGRDVVIKILPGRGQPERVTLESINRNDGVRHFVAGTGIDDELKFKRVTVHRVAGFCFENERLLSKLFGAAALLI